MWKGRSMYGAELNGNAIQSIPPSQSVLSFSDNLSSLGATYGSNHTAFALGAPFANSGSSIYHSMPTKLPPIIYGSPASIPSIPDSLPYDPYDRQNIDQTTATRPHNGSASTPPPPERPSKDLFARKPLVNNPLPEPPRESTYQPAPLPPLKPATSSRTSGDYWSKYTTVTTVK